MTLFDLLDDAPVPALPLVVCERQVDRSAKSAYNAQAYRRERHAAFRFLGGRCVRCGCEDWRCLQIDHIEGDGYRQTHKRQDQRRAAKGDIEGLQLLCANCHAIKTHEVDSKRPAYGRRKVM